MADFYVKLPSNSASVSGSVTVASSVLPDGASTSALQTTSNSLQTTANSILTSLNNKVTITNVGGLDSINVKVTDITLSSDGDSVETRSQAMATRLDEVSSTLNYVGEAAVGSADSAAVWRIKRITTTGTVLKIEYASSSYNQIWNNRAALTYT